MIHFQSFSFDFRVRFFKMPMNSWPVHGVERVSAATLHRPTVPDVTTHFTIGKWFSCNLKKKYTNWNYYVNIWWTSIVKIEFLLSFYHFSDKSRIDLNFPYHGLEIFNWTSIFNLSFYSILKLSISFSYKIYQENKLNNLILILNPSIKFWLQQSTILNLSISILNIISQ